MSRPGALPVAPELGVLWRRTFVIVLIGTGLFFLDRLTVLLATYWFFEAVDLSPIFWTNLRWGAALFAIGFVLFASAIVAPAYVHPVSSSSRRLYRLCGMAVGLVVAYLFALQYAQFLPTPTTSAPWKAQERFRSPGRPPFIRARCGEAGPPGWKPRAA